MNKLLIPILLLVFLFAQKGVDAQDRLFSQYYSAPLLLNPGLTGSFDGKYRIGTNYRDQWRTVLDAPFRTSSISLESKFPLQNVFKFIRKDNLALGLLFYSDKVGGVDFNTTQISLSIAYHKSLDDDNKHYLSIGFQGGIVQRNVNFEDFTFDDQFNGLDGYSFATGEVLPSNNFSFSDYSTGLNYSFSPNRKMRIFLGGSYQHIFAPEQTFYDTEDGFSNKLFSKYNTQVSFSYAFTNQFSVIPRALVALQGPHMEINAGSNFRLSIIAWLRNGRCTDWFEL